MIDNLYIASVTLLGALAIILNILAIRNHNRSK
jgi:hypothetical protein